jgi:hypothetical protein
LWYIAQPLINYVVNNGDVEQKYVHCDDNDYVDDCDVEQKYFDCDDDNVVVVVVVVVICRPVFQGSLFE